MRNNLLNRLCAMITLGVGYLFLIHGVMVLLPGTEFQIVGRDSFLIRLGAAVVFILIGGSLRRTAVGTTDVEKEEK